jgi:hypothetical protein
MAAGNNTSHDARGVCSIALVLLSNWAPGQLDLGVLGCLGLLGTWALGLFVTAVKVGVLRASHKIFLSLTGKFE